MSYSDFVNELRLKEARLLLIEPEKKNYSIAAIAEESGFKSLSRFNVLFKEKFAQTPSEFQKENFSNPI